MIESVLDQVLAEASRQQGLAEAVATLRDEVRGLRAAARLRAVIEQAKGVLVERHHITLEEAFDQLRKMSQEHNVRLIEVAATVVGVAIPSEDDIPDHVLRERVVGSPSPSATWTALQAQPEVRAGVNNALLSSLAGSTTAGDEGAKLITELLADEGVVASTMYRLASDGSLRLLGKHGIPWDEMSPWSSIPPSRDIPYFGSVQQNHDYFWADREERVRQFPAVRPTTRFEAAATIPIADQGEVIGVVGLCWLDHQKFDAERTSRMSALVRRVAPVLMRNVAMADPELAWLDSVLNLHLDPWLHLQTIYAADRSVHGFVVLSAAPGLVSSSDWLGRGLLELWPAAAQDGTLTGLRSLVQTGGAWSTTVSTPSDTPWGIPGSRVRAVRLGGRVVMAWRPVEPAGALRKPSKGYEVNLRG